MGDPQVQRSWYQIDDAVGMGLPPLNDKDLPTCGTDHVISKTCSMKGMIP